MACIEARHFLLDQIEGAIHLGPYLYVRWETGPVVGAGLRVVSLKPATVRRPRMTADHVLERARRGAGPGG